MEVKRRRRKKINEKYVIRITKGLQLWLCFSFCRHAHETMVFISSCYFATNYSVSETTLYYAKYDGAMAMR